MMLKGFSRRLYLEELYLFRSQLFWKRLKMELNFKSQWHLSRHTGTRPTLLYRETITITPPSCQDSSPISCQSRSTTFCRPWNLSALIIVWATSPTARWSQPPLGTRTCWTSTDSGQLTTRCSIQSTRRWDPLWWLTSTRPLRCPSTSQHLARESLKYRSSLISTEAQGSSI